MEMDYTKLRMNSAFIFVSDILRKINDAEIDIHISALEVWNNDKKSSLIESIIANIPLPSFYVDAEYDDEWIMIDGRQRLSAIKLFMNGHLKLSNLEYFHGLEGYRFDDLPRKIQRNIEETTLLFHKIIEGTPPDIKANIEKRVNK